MVRGLCALLVCVSVPAFAADVSEHLEACKEKYADCKEDCSMSFGTKVKYRVKLGKCLNKCKKTETSCRNSITELEEAGIDHVFGMPGGGTGTAPGQTGTMPGNASDAPGNPGGASGQADNSASAPGQTGTTPSADGTAGANGSRANAGPKVDRSPAGSSRSSDPTR